MTQPMGHQRRSSMPMISVRTGFIFEEPSQNPMMGSASSVILGGSIAASMPRQLVPAATASNTATAVTTTTTTTTSTTTATATTTTTTGATITTTTTSAPGPAVQEDEGRGRKTRRKEKRTGPRGKSMERILAPDSKTGVLKLSPKLTWPTEMAEKMARAETANFSAIATRKLGSPVYRGAFPKGSENYYDTMWRPMTALLADSLDASFTEVEKRVDALYGKWMALVQSLDKQSPEERRAMLEKETGLSKKDRGTIENQHGALNDKSLSRLQAVQKLLDKVLDPVLIAINGDGKSVLSSSLSPTFLLHLIELDAQHTMHWGPTSKRLLEWQLFYHEMQDTIAQVNQLRKLDPEAQVLAALEAELKANMNQWQQHATMLSNQGVEGKAELEKLNALTEKRISASEAKSIKEQIEQHDLEFRQTRHEALESFICIRGCAVVLQFLAEEFERIDAAKGRLYKVLRELLLAAIPRLPIIDQLMDCAPQEKEAIRKAALADFPRQQKAWDLIREDQTTANRWERLRVTDESREKRKKKAEAAEQDVGAPISSASEKPRGPAMAPVSGKERKRLSQPSRALSEKELLARREKRVKRFLDEHRIGERIQTIPGLEDSLILAGLKQALLSMTKDRVTDAALLKTALAFLGNAMFDMDGEPSADLRELLAELSSELVALEVAAPSSIPGQKSPRDKPGASGQ